MTGSAKAVRCARLREVALDLPDAGRLRILALRFAQLPVELAAQAASRRCQRSGSPPMTADSTISFSHFHGARSVPATTMSSSSTRAVDRAARPRAPPAARSTRAKPVTASSAGTAGSGARAASLGVRHLAERQVFGEPGRRQALDRAGEQREERAARRDAAGGRRARTRPGCRRARRRPRAGRRSRPCAQHHRHLVEGNAGARLLQDPPRDLDALAALAGRREQPHFAGRLALGRLPAGEQVAAQRGEVGRAGRLEHLRLDAERFEMIERGEVAERHQDERRAACSIRRRARANSTADSNGTSSSSSGRPANAPAASAAASKSVARSVADAAANCASNRSSSAARSAPPSGSARSASARRAQRELVERSRQRAREARRRGHRREVRSSPACAASNAARAATASVPIRVTGTAPRAARTGAARCAASCVKLKRCRPRAPPRASRDRPREVVRGAARRADDHRPAPAVRVEPLACGIEPERGLGGFDDAKGERGKDVSSRCTCPGRHAGSPSAPAPRE